MARLVLALSRVWLIAALGVLASCTYQGLPELTLKQVSLAEWPAGAQRPAAPVLLVQLAGTGRSGSYPDAPYVGTGFCGERFNVARLGQGELFTDQASKWKHLVGEKYDAPVTDTSASLYAVINLNRPEGLALAAHPDIFPDYDLRHDDRDVCLKTVVSRMVTASVSNTVRIPRYLITMALHEGIKPLPTLLPFVEIFPIPKMTLVGPR